MNNSDMTPNETKALFVPYEPPLLITYLLHGKEIVAACAEDYSNGYE